MSEIIVYGQKKVLKYCQRKTWCDCPTNIETNIQPCNYKSIFVALNVIVTFQLFIMEDKLPTS